MIDILLDAVSWAFLLSGGAFLLIGGLGMVRLPDFYTRMHAAGVMDTMGAELMLMGMVFQAGFSMVTVKLLLIGVFVFVTSPTATHAVANAALVAGLEPKVSNFDDGEPHHGVVGDGARHGRSRGVIAEVGKDGGLPAFGALGLEIGDGPEGDLFGGLAAFEFLWFFIEGGEQTGLDFFGDAVHFFQRVTGRRGHAGEGFGFLAFGQVFGRRREPDDDGGDGSERAGDAKRTA